LEHTVSEPFVIARTAAGDDVLFRPSLANRHGLVTGATGTGKTVTLQVLAEHFSRIGVPVFMADVKGDLSGIAAAGAMSPKLAERLKATGLDAPAFAASPVAFWDVFGKRGVPVRATISDLGPLLLGRLFGLNATQQGVLALVFKVADDNGLLLLDLKDLRATFRRRRSARSNGRCWRSTSRAAPRFSANRCSTSTICCRPTARVAAW
jgi:DNA helicase HerA-like ATPase